MYVYAYIDFKSGSHRELAEFSAILPPWRSWDSNSCGQAWLQVRCHTEQYLQSTSMFPLTILTDSFTFFCCSYF